MSIRNIRWFWLSYLRKFKLIFFKWFVYLTCLRREGCISIVVGSFSYGFDGHFTGGFAGFFTDEHFFFEGAVVTTLRVGVREGLGKTHLIPSYV